MKNWGIMAHFRQEKFSGDWLCCSPLSFTGVWDGPVELEVSFNSSFCSSAAGSAWELGATSLEAAAAESSAKSWILSHLKNYNIQTKNFLVGRECHLRVLLLQKIRFIMK